jgi:hypothetical protein
MKSPVCFTVGESHWEFWVSRQLWGGFTLLIFELTTVCERLLSVSFADIRDLPIIPKNRSI